MTCVPWEADLACCGDEWTEHDEALQARALALAWDTLATLTAGRVGRCPVTVRPCLTEPCDLCSTRWMQPTLVAGTWMNNVCGTPKCSCERLCEIILGGVVARIEAVMMDGIMLDPALVRVDNGNRIVRVDGLCWPSCQRMDCPLTEPCTVGITYTPGIIPDEAGLWAAGVLACEFAKACTGGKCRLPTAITSLSRQGVTMELSTTMFPDGMTGIREVDAYVLSVNPNALKIPPSVWSPDVPWAGHRYVTS